MWTPSIKEIKKKANLYCGYREKEIKNCPIVEENGKFYFVFADKNIEIKYEDNYRDNMVMCECGAMGKPTMLLFYRGNHFCLSRNNGVGIKEHKSGCKKAEIYKSLLNKF